MTQRQSALLATIINSYVRSAQPVSSKLLEKSGFFDLKSATIRLGMTDLEDNGYLTHLHTSGGRVPTDKAYRYFVDNLVGDDNDAITNKEKLRIHQAIYSAPNSPRMINKTIGQVLSDISDNLVITKVIEEDDFFKTGLSCLFEMPDFREFDKVFRLTNFFDEFESVFNGLINHVFSEMSRTENLKIFIGRENSVRNVRDETLILAKYNLPHSYTGSLTLIGPTRMNYKKNIGLIKYATSELNNLAKKT